MSKCKRCENTSEPHEELCLEHLKEEDEARAEGEGMVVVKPFLTSQQELYNMEQVEQTEEFKEALDYYSSHDDREFWT